MANKKNILVFPCGSEIALEVYRSVKNSTHFNLIGASSIDDHGKFVFENYVGGLPFITAPEFIPAIKKVVADNAIEELEEKNAVSHRGRAIEKMLKEI